MNVKLCYFIAFIGVAYAGSEWELDEEECEELQHEFINSHKTAFQLNNCSQFFIGLKRAYKKMYGEDGHDRLIEDLRIAFAKIKRSDLIEFLDYQETIDNNKTRQENVLAEKEEDEIPVNDLIAFKHHNPLQFIKDLVNIKDYQHSILNDVFKLGFIITLITLIQAFVCCACFKFFCPVLYRDMRRTVKETLSK